MTEQELVNKVIEGLGPRGYSYWDGTTIKANLSDIISIILEALPELAKEARYKSLEDCQTCNQRQLESERMLNREVAFDERILRDEIQDWKDRYYELGGR